jgi:hypothetical protein
LTCSVTVKILRGLRAYLPQFNIRINWARVKKKLFKLKVSVDYYDVLI